MKTTDHRIKLEQKHSISTKEPNSPVVFQPRTDMKQQSNFSKIKSKIIESRQEQSNGSSKHFQRNNQFKDKVDKSISRNQHKNYTSIQEFGLKFTSPRKIETVLSHSRKKQIIKNATENTEGGPTSLTTNVRLASQQRAHKNHVQKLQFLQTQGKQQNNDHRKYNQATQRLPRSQNFLQQKQFSLNLQKIQQNRPPSRCRSTVSKIAVHNQNKQQVLSFTGVFNRNHQAHDTFYIYWKKKAYEYLDQNMKLSQEIKQLKRQRQNQKNLQFQRQKQKTLKTIEGTTSIDHGCQFSTRSFQHDLTKKIKYYQQELEKKITQIISLEQKIIQLNQKIVDQKKRDMLMESMRQQLIDLSKQNSQLRQRSVQQRQIVCENPSEYYQSTSLLKAKINQYEKQKRNNELPPKYRTQNAQLKKDKLK